MRKSSFISRDRLMKTFERVIRGGPRWMPHYSEARLGTRSNAPVLRRRRTRLRLPKRGPKAMPERRLRRLAQQMPQHPWARKVLEKIRRQRREAKQARRA